VRKTTATIENITPPSERDLGGVTVYLVEITFRLDQQDELDKAWGVSQDTGRLWQADWSEGVYPVENGVFVATLPADPSWQVGKKLTVLLPNVAE
jgi:hypothetical protein